VGVELRRDLGDEGPLRGREGVPDRALRHAPWARRRLCTHTHAQRSDLG
jgi:hypothetical protein